MKQFHTFAESLSDNHNRLLHELLEALRVLLARRFKQVKKENDASVLLAIAQTFQLKNVLFLSSVELSDDLKHVVKAYLVVGDKFLDATGFYDKPKVMQKNKLSQGNFTEKTFTASLDLLTQFAAQPSQKSPLNVKERTELYALVNSFYDKLGKALS